MTDQKLDPELSLSLDSREAGREGSLNLNTGFDATTRRWELIIRYSGELTLPDDIQMIPLYGGYAIISIPENQIEAFSRLSQVEYIEKPKNLILSLYEARAASCITIVQNPPFSLTGKGVLVGIIDSGIDIFHPDFQNDDGTTRILELWDQTIPEENESFYNRGRVFTRDDINQALSEGNRNFPSRDVSGHGTHVAGIAAGNGRASGGRQRGVAIESELLIVKLGNVFPDAFPRTTELMLAIQYCIQKAIDLGRPLALNLSFGNSYGSHDGSSLVETFIDNISSLGRTTIAIGSGNEGNKGRHASGRLTEETTTQIEFAVSENETSLNLQLWKNYVDSFDVRLLSPSGESTMLTKQAVGVYRDTLDNTRILWYFGEPSPYHISQEVYVELLPIAGSSYIQSGIWKLQLIPSRIIDGTYNLWLPSANTINPATRFLVPSEETTLTIPSTASQPITVAAYNSATDALAPFSGQGYTELSLPKPDLAAPGVNIISTAPGGGYTANTGTSMATPFVTGSAALLMQYGIINGADPYLYGQKVKAYLQRGARPLPFETNYPSQSIGWGALCLRDSLP
nr:S8 family serine peptidase [Eubacterium sp.]